MRRHAFTLIEMVTSLVILSVLLLACGSIVGMAARATGDTAVRTAAQLDAADATARLTDDLNVATNFTQRTANAATFTVPDRLNAGAPQAITYSWSGASGAPLLRSFNGGTATTVLAGVKALKFDYLTRVAGPAPAAAEQELFTHLTTTGALKDYALTDKKWACESFTPALPLGTASYSITRMRIMMKTGSQDSVLAVSIRTADGFNRPTATILGQTTVYVSAFSSSYELIDVPFTGVSGIGPLQNICVVVSYLSGNNNAASIQFDQALLSILNGATWSTSSNAGTSWTVGSATSSAMMSIYGTVP